MVVSGGVAGRGALPTGRPRRLLSLSSLRAPPVLEEAPAGSGCWPWEGSLEAVAVTVGRWVKLGRTGGLREFDIQGSRIVRLSGL